MLRTCLRGWTSEGPLVAEAAGGTGRDPAAIGHAVELAQSGAGIDEQGPAFCREGPAFGR